LELCSELPLDIWHLPPAAGEWSAYEVLGHLFDVDIVYGFRWRLMLTQDNPAYPGYDERAWARLRKPPPGGLLSAFVALRSANVALIRSLDETDRQRTAVHSEQGSETVVLMIRKIAGHDLAHLDQLRSTVDLARAKDAGGSQDGD
jgi:hypothetical protein